MSAEPKIIDVEDADTFVPLDEQADRVVRAAGQALASRQEQNNVPMTPAETSAMTPMQMAYQLIQQGADLGSVKEMLALSKELAADQARRAFDEAVALAKAEIPIVGKNAKGHNDKRYADFSAYAKAVDPVITRYGLSYRFRSEQNGGQITVTCVLSHKAGHSEENSLSGPADSSGSKNAIQAIGSTLTYLQRYTLIQALGLAASVDDDGRASGAGETISPAQLSQLRTAIEDTASDIAKFCEVNKIDALPDLPARNFDTAMRMLDQKKARMQERRAS